MKEKKIENLIWIIFFTIGTLFFIIGVFMCKNIFNYENTIDTKGKITQITKRGSGDESEYDVYVTYQVEGKSYESIIHGYSSNFYEGKEIEIYYNKSNPKKIGVKSLDLVFLIFPIIGLIVLIIGFIGLLNKYNKKNLKKKLKNYGDRIEANYVKTEINSCYSVNGRNPYNIICKWNNPEDNIEYTFKSENLWDNPQEIIEKRNIKTFTVYIDMNNKKKYVIETEILNEKDNF